jgi:hypothetical protein
LTPNLIMPSIHQLKPLEEGGVIARNGFVFQDHVAIHFCLEMLFDSKLKQVWCETQDDITLIWEGAESEEVEFVQVKSNDLTHFWSVSELCKQESKKENNGQKSSKVGSSILEKSLAYDRCHEPCRFRMVTSVGVNEELRFLKLPFTSPDRNRSNPKYVELCSKVRDKVKGFKSGKGRDSDFWLLHTYWQVEHDSAALKNKNREMLRELLNKYGAYLAPDQVEELYAKLLQKVQKAALAISSHNPKAKKLVKTEFEQWLQQTIDDAQHPTAKGSSGIKLETKLRTASLSEEIIEFAQEARRYYREEKLNPKYFEMEDQNLADRAVRATLHQLLAELDAENLPNNGPQFHAKCLAELQVIRQNLGTKVVPELMYLQGCMYTITERCVHRFRRD